MVLVKSLPYFCWALALARYVLRQIPFWTSTPATAPKCCGWCPASGRRTWTTRACLGWDGSPEVGKF